MKGTLKLENGRELTVEIDENTLKSIEEPKKTGYARGKASDYYYVEYDGTVYLDMDMGSDSDNSCYETANYYSDKTVAENNARADALMRKLRRFAVEHREKEFCWNDEPQIKYEVYYYHKGQDIKTSPCQTRQNFGSIYFDTLETAKAAIEEFKDELLWYFTEYKDSL